MAAVYADAHMKWGFAACPDEMALEHRVLATLEANGAASTADLERVLAVPRWRLRDLVTPRASTPAGFARPKYVDWADRGAEVSRRSLALTSRAAALLPGRSCFRKWPTWGQPCSARVDTSCTAPRTHSPPASCSPATTWKPGGLA